MPSMARYDAFGSPSPSGIARPSSVRTQAMQSLFDGSEDDNLPCSAAGSIQKIRPIGFRDMAIAPIMPQSSYRERYNQLRQHENDKNSLIEDLLRQVENSQQKIEQLQLDHDHESCEELKQKSDGLEREIEGMRVLLEQNSYATVLIDGDSLSFNRELLSQGGQGGQEAGRVLTSTIRDFFKHNLPDSTNAKLNFKFFFDKDAVTDKLVRAGVYGKAAEFQHFLRGFLDQEFIFDVIDTGLHDGLTLRKMQESYRHDFLNVHCHQILLASVNSAGINELLLEKPEVPVHERVTLLTASGLASTEIINQEIQSLSMEHVLCKMHSPVEPIKAVPVKLATPVLARVESNSSSKTMNSTQVSAASTPVLTWAAMTAQPFVPKPGESRSGNSTPISVSKQPPTAKVTTAVNRNKHGQRIDPVDNSIPYQELQRIKKMKLCNIYYLQGKAYCAGDCNHSHDYPLRNAEKNILREVARMTPCHFRTDCDEPGCIYGHRCPQNKPEKSSCYYKADCRFHGWGHGIDEKIVKTQMIK